MLAYAALWLPPVAATAILLAATRRTWRHHRRFKTALGLTLAFAALTVGLGYLPPALATVVAPLLALIALCVVCTLGEWRHAPDFGQRGLLWLLPRAAAPALLGALGLLATQTLWFASLAPDLLQLPLLFTGSLASLLPFPRSFFRS
ncbi:MAG: hypothetical protein NTU80_02085 [Verrucomicrobia bacterium]|nr:hypothetical protein [Verrucomicrobiota bacterium]